jgi:hypothetical protein
MSEAMKSARALVHGAPLTAFATLVALTLPPRIALANSFDGLEVLVMGMMVGVPVSVVLLISIVTSLVLGARTPRPWHSTWATANLLAAPVLALVFPVSVVVPFGARSLLPTLVCDVPVIVLATIAVMLARRVGDKATGAAI